MQLPTEAQLLAAGFPDELRPYILSGTLLPHHVRPDGTLEFMVPNPAEPKSAFTLVWHPEDPATWDYEDNRFFVKEEKFGDVGHYDPVGSEWVALRYDSEPETVEDLIDWLDTLPSRRDLTPPDSEIPVGDEQLPPPPTDPRLDFAEAVLALLTDTPIGSGSDFIDDVTRCATIHGLIEPDPARIVDGAIDEDLPEWRRTQATAPDESEGRKAGTEEPDRRWFIVIGRGYGDDEASTARFLASNQAEAQSMFCDFIAEEAGVPRPADAGPGYAFLDATWDCGTRQPRLVG